MSTSRRPVIVICAAIFKIAHLPLSMSVPPYQAISGGLSCRYWPDSGDWGITGLYSAVVLASITGSTVVLKFGGRAHRARGSSTTIAKFRSRPEPGACPTLLARSKSRPRTSRTCDPPGEAAKAEVV